MKVMVIGLDGASPLLMEKWIEELPTFRRLKEKGWWGLSIPPPNPYSRVVEKPLLLQVPSFQYSYSRV